MIQRKRFTMPWRFRNWEFTYGWALTDLFNRKNNIDMSNETEKKKYNNQKTKLHQRLGKIYKEAEPITEKDGKKPLLTKNLLEVKKEIAYCMDGSLKTL